MGKRFTKPKLKPVPLKSNDARIAHLIGSDTIAQARAVLIGFPCDAGVRANQGRAGAAEGPKRIREELYRLTPDVRHVEQFTSLITQTTDLGDLKLEGDLKRDQEVLGEEVSRWLSRDSVPIVLGGGHETSFGHFLGYHLIQRSMTIFNVDAHLDVREVVDGVATSGTPFRQAIEHPSHLVKHYVVLGAQPHSISDTHRNYVESHGEVILAQDLSVSRVESLFSSGSESIFLSMDLDALGGSLVPGVSSPNANGIPLSLWFGIAEMAGLSPRVRSMDLVEMNPKFDITGQSARIAALTVWHFLSGLARRAIS